MEGLDQASLRRFDLKLRFGFLTTAQAWELFGCQCRGLGMDAPPLSLAPALAAIDVLTPGDFAAVARQHRFRRLVNPVGLLDALVAECAVKEGGLRNAIGFA